MSPFTNSTNLLLPNENPIFSNYLPISSINEKNGINVNPSGKPLSPISRFNATSLYHSRSKTLQRLPTVDKETCNFSTMNARKQRTKMPLNQSSYPHNGCKNESFPSINIHPNNFPTYFKDVYSNTESCFLPNLNVTVSKDQELCIQDKVLNKSSCLSNPLKQLDNFDFPSSVKSTNLLKSSLSFNDDVMQESLRLPQLFTDNTITSTSSIHKLDNSSFRKLIPSIKSFRRKLLPTQSFDISSSRQYSEDCPKSLKPQKSFCDSSTNKCKDLNLINNDSKLKTSHSADTCLHTYSSYNEFLYPQDKKSENFDSNFENSTCRTYPINPKFWLHNTDERNSLITRNSAFVTGRPLYFPSTYSNNNYNNQQVFVPIIRSESTPCICSPNFRIGIKRRADEVERPTANFAKMWVSQFDSNDSASDVSPLHDRKRFSSRSPDSIPDEWGSGSNLGFQEFHNVKSFESNDCCNEKLDLQSIEEN